MAFRSVVDTDAALSVIEWTGCLSSLSSWNETRAAMTSSGASRRLTLGSSICLQGHDRVESRGAASRNPTGQEASHRNHECSRGVGQGILRAGAVQELAGQAAGTPGQREAD